MKPEDLKNDGFQLSQGDMLEAILTYLISNQLTSSEILRRQLELTEQLKGSEIDDNKIEDEIIEMTKLIAEQATSQKNDLIAKLYSNQKE